MAAAVLLGLAGLSFLLVLNATRIDYRTPQLASASVAKQSNIERQYALALIKNDLKHFYAVSEYFPPNDPVSRNYKLKADLQIARKVSREKSSIWPFNRLRKFWSLAIPTRTSCC